jgi:hypothetical protein
MTIEELLDEHTDAVAELAFRLLAHLADGWDWSETRVWSGWHGVGFHHAKAGYVVGLFPCHDDVRVLFEDGHLLGDAPYLEGNGQTRTVAFTEWDEARLAVVDDLLDRALAT